MKKILSLVLFLVFLISFSLSSVMASEFSEKDYKKAFSILEDVRNKDDNYEVYLKDKFVAERYEIMAMQQQRDDFVLRYQDIPEKDRNIFESTYEYMKTTHVTKTTHPDNWIGVYDRKEYKVVPYQIVEMSRSMVWLEQMDEVITILMHYPEDENNLSSNMKKSYEEFLNEIPMYIESFDAIINYTNWVLEKPENELNSRYEQVEGYPYDWFQHEIFYRLKDEAEVLKNIITPLSFVASGEGTVTTTSPTKTQYESDFGGLGTTGLLIGLMGGMVIGGYRRLKGENTSLFWHIRNAITVNSKNISVLSKHTKTQDVIKISLNKIGVTNQQTANRAIKGFKSVGPILKVAPLVHFFFDMKDAVAKPNKTETDIRQMGEKTVEFIVNGVFMIGGAFIGAEIGMAAGLAVGSPTGPGAGLTAFAGAGVGAFSGSMIGDYVGSWVSEKVSHFGGNIAMNMYEYSHMNDNVIANFLKKIF